MRYLVCNLKNKMNKQQALEYSKNIEELNNTNLIIVPSMLYIDYFQNAKCKIGSQDISSFMEETITGEITGSQLESIGVSFVLVGHSERRKYKNEINIDFINKINHAQEYNFKIIYCIGETLEEKEKNETYNVLEKQISEVLNNVSLKDIIIAYEPVWAIGTGKVASAKEINETVEYIKDIIDEKYECSIKVLYGGSVTPENISELNNIENIDGFLVGGASLNADNVQKMLEIIEKNA